MSSEFGRTLRVGVFGQSHGAAIGVSIDGLPAGERIDLAELQAFLDRRRPGKSPLSTARKENDVPQFLSGLRDGVTCGSPLCAVIYNSDQHSSDYMELADKPRPSHADYTAWVKWGRAGGYARRRTFFRRPDGAAVHRRRHRQAILARHGVFIGAHLAAVGTEDDEAFPLYPTDELFRAVAAKPFPTISDAAGERMQRLILAAREAQDSVGGIVECAAIGLPAGLGDPMFDGMENRLASALFGIPAVKGVEFGRGASALRACAEAKTTTPSAWRTAASSRRRTAPGGHPRRHHHRYAAHAARRHQADTVHRQTAENGLARADGKHRADYPGPSRPLHRAPRRARR